MLTKHNTSEPALHINEINVKNKYKFLSKIGQGSYGTVWLVLPIKLSSKKFQSKQYVLKRLDLCQTLNSPSQNDIESAEREAKLLSTLKHPNIVAYTESFRSNDGFLNIVMAYCEGGDLYTKLKEKKTKKETLSEDQIIEWFIQICMALQYIHEKNILHRDLKTQNIFLTKNEIVKVGDLGIARVLKSGNDFATTIIGTPYYMSPEIFSHKPYGQKSDIWSLGCCVYEMLTLEHVFNAKDMNALVFKIIREQTPQIPKKYSEPLTDIITSMLKKDPEDRPTAKTILQNSYIKQHIIRLLEKSQMKCQNQVKSNSQPIVSVSPASSPSRPPSSSNPSSSRPTSASNPSSSRPTSGSNPSSSRPTSASNPSSSRSRLLNNNSPVLPSYPVIPSSHSRPPLSSADIHRSIPVVEPIPSNEPAMSNPRIRRRLHSGRSNRSPVKDEEKKLKFLSNVSQNDTLQRFRHNQQLNNPLKQYQQPSSSDEQDTSPVRPSNDYISQPVVVVEPPQRQIRPSSVESSRNPSRSLSHSQITKSCDLNQVNSSARRRRRENKLHSSSPEYSTPNEIAINNESQDHLIVEIEKKKEGEKDMNDLVFMLTVTLQLPPVNQLTDNEKTIIENRYSQNKIWSSGDRTIAGPLHETNRLYQRCELIRENCLQEISPEQLRRVLKILENVSEAQMMQEMINELGEDLYEKYSGQIFSLKFYEDNLFTHS